MMRRVREVLIDMSGMDGVPIASKAPGSAGTIPRWRIEDLTKGGGEAEIMHDGSIYRLRITSNRKLILTK